MTSRKRRREALRHRVEGWAHRLRVHPRVVQIRPMTRKWGSCSYSGRVSFAEDLAGETPRFQDYVIAHELLHLRVKNHGRLFKALMSLHLPGWKRYKVASGRQKR